MSGDRASRSLGVQLWASAPGDPRSRRAVDAVRVVLAGCALVTVLVLSRIGDDLDREVSDSATRFPGFLRVVWMLGFWGALVWSTALIVVSIVRRRLATAAEAIGAALLALAVASLCARLVDADASDVIARLVDVDGPPVFPPAALAVSTAVIAVTVPFVTEPFRRLGRAFVLAQAVGALFLGHAFALGVVTALTIGLLVGAATNYGFGSPGGLPTIARVRDALAGLDARVEDLRPTRFTSEGVAVLEGRHGDEPVAVKVYGRDAWEGQLLADLWRQTWYRGARRHARLRRGQYVEHEGFVTLLAARAGVDVPTVLIAGRADNGDALIVTVPNGRPLDPDATLSAVQLDELWTQLDRLHGSGIVHHRIDLDRVVLDGERVGMGDLSSADVRRGPADVIADRAQMLAFGVAVSDPDIALDAAARALGDEGLTAVLPYLQDAALPPGVRSRLRRRHLDLDDVRGALAARLGEPDVELVAVRRVTWRSLLNIVLLAVAASTIIGMVSGLDLGSFARELGEADYWWLLAALVLGQLPRVANAVSTMGSSMQPLPFGPTVGLQFSACYVNLAVPSSAGRVAITTRFFQRFGVPPATALSAGVIDSFSELLVQFTLFVAVLFLADVDLGLTFDTAQLAGLATTALIVVAVAALVGLVAMAVPRVRARLRTWAQQAGAAMAVLKVPRRLIQLFGGNLLSQVLFAVALAACVRAFGGDVPLSSLILVNTIVSLFAGLLPVPGGVGVTEAGIALGLTRAGLPPETAFAVALTYRFCTFYLPPIWGLQAYRWMTRHRYL
jgi:uncharacterized membrane protein YbhN (UPF0104 family)